jgi:hypothetical protein
MAPAPRDGSAPAQERAVAWRPELDLPASRLEERVNGAAEALRAAGCTRLLSWRSAAPPADLEALVFDNVDHARAALAREAGAERTEGPGDEAQVSDQAVYFRQGTVFVRVLADPGQGGAPLVALARRLEPELAALR